jgi:TetR/AcrR family transcriptional repressor of nem operon
MPRPRSFDQAAVLDAAVAAFWQGGPGTTSVDEVLRVTGLARSSLYNSFGSKNKLLQQAIERYVDRQIAELGRVFHERSLQQALETLFLDIVRHNNEGRGCLLINSVNELRGTSDATLDVVQAGFARIARRLADLASGASAQVGDANVLAAEIITAIAGLRTLQKTGLPSSLLRQTAKSYARRLATP